MSWKSTLITVGVIILTFAVIGYFYGEHKYIRGYDDTVATLSQDSTEVIIDTFYIKGRETTVYIPYYAEAVIDTVDNTIIYSTQIDTSVVIDKDTIAVLTQDIVFSEGYFDILTNILIKPVEKLVKVTKTEFRTVIKEVEADPPFYNTWIAGFISGIVLFLSLVIFI